MQERIQKASRPLRPQASDLFRYLKAIVELRTKVVRVVDDYESVFWLSDAPAVPGCLSILRDEDDCDGAWLHLERPVVPERPEEPALCAPFLSREELDVWTSEPILRPIGSTEAARVGDGPESAVPEDVAESFALYMAQAWLPWAAERRRIAPLQQVYGQLFGLAQMQDRLSENFEVMLGVGLLSIAAGQPVRRHLIAAKAEITLDRDLGTITVGPPPTGPDARLECEMLEVTDRPPAHEVYQVERQVEQLQDLFDDGAQSVLRRWANLMGPEAQFEPDMRPPTPPHNGKPRVNFAPAIILRKRNQNATLSMFDAILGQLGEADLSLSGCVDILLGCNEEGKSGRHLREPHEEETSVRQEDEVFFPLPANEEQLEIVRRLKHANGILVQGPPGTGKSHTIANLIAHYLAQGKRILITSHTARALKVLKSKIPQELQPLIVSLLGADRDAITELETSVQGITQRQQDWSPSAESEAAVRLSNQLDEARRRAAKASKELVELREAETVSHEIAGYSGSASAIAARVSEERPLYEWFTDEAAGEEPPIAPADAGEVLELLAALGAGADDTRLIALERLVPTEEFSTLLATEEELAQRIEGEPPSVARYLMGRDPEDRKQVVEAVRTVLHVLERLESNIRSWVPTAIQLVLAGEPHRYASLAQTLSGGLERLSQAALIFSGHSVEGVDTLGRAEVKRLATELRTHLASGGALRKGPFSTKEARRARPLLDAVRVDGAPACTAESLKVVLAHVAGEELLQAMEAELAEQFEAPRTGWAQREACLNAEAAVLLELMRLDESTRVLKKLVRALKFEVGEPNSVEKIRTLEKSLAVADLMHRHAGVERNLESLTRSIQAVAARDDAHPAVANLRDAIKARDPVAFEVAREEIVEAWRLRQQMRRRDELISHLQSYLPRLTASLLETHSDQGVWIERCESLAEAWRWRKAEQWVSRVSRPGRERQLTEELEEADQAERQALAGLAASRAWRATIEGLTDEEAQNLKAWAFAVRRLGKGTGRHAGKWRAEARKNMQQCRTAIPAWIMPMYQVASNVSPAPGAFDVIIVDEASQSGVEALFLMYLGKQVIVVGDDQQISPESVGLDLDDVEALEMQYLTDIPFPKTLSLQSSLFSRAQVQFGDAIRLREHFRCMPEIIQFSNQLCYEGMPLIPLRQYGSERLEPIVARYIEEGYREGAGANVVNPPEAEAVVDAIAKCCADPAYDGRTFGVISLQGLRQARRIQDLLLERLGHKEFMEREIVCGDAYAFQGDERDVVMMSMVAAPNARIGPLSRVPDVQRFNVAASRGRDQVWLFHSVRPQDLSTSDLRRRLLEYYLRPVVQGDEPLDYEAASDRVVAPFESIFEQRVYTMIRGRGYRVQPQVPVAGYRIDLVVEGMRGRLAVECDGDAWHGPERWEHDNARQRQLERAGWTFWRVRGSEFFADPEAALGDLWDTLEELGIRPGVERENRAPAPSSEIDHLVAASEDVTTNAAQGPDDSSSGSLELTDPVGRPVGLLDGEGRKEEDDAGQLEEEPAVRNAQALASVRAVEAPVAVSSGHLPPGVRPRLDRYVAWPSRWLPDPGEANRRDLEQALTDIVEAEGPILARRAYGLVVKAANRQRVTQAVVRVMDPITTALCRKGRIVAEEEWDSDSVQDLILRAPGVPVVLMRDRGPRELYEVPPLEAAALLNQLRAIDPSADREGLQRALLAVYGLVRLTQRVEQYLVRAEALVVDPRTRSR